MRRILLGLAIVAAAVVLVALWPQREDDAQRSEASPGIATSRDVAPPQVDMAESVERTMTEHAPVVVADAPDEPADPLPPIRGRVLDRVGWGVAGVEIHELRDRDGFVLVATTDGGGAFVLARADAFPTKLHFRHDGHAPQIREGMIAGDETTVVLDDAFEVRGAVHDANDGHALAGATVRLHDPRGAPGVAVTSGTDGAFRLFAGRDSTWIEIECAGYWPSRHAIDPGPDAAPIDAGLDTQQDTFPRAWFRVVGADDGAPVAEVTFEGVPGEAFGDGRYRGLVLGNAAEGCTVTLEAPGRARMPVRFQSPAGDDAAHPVQVSMPATGSLSGRLLDARGKPIAGADVTAAWTRLPTELDWHWNSSAGRATSFGATSAADGTFRIDGLPAPGEYRLQVFGPTFVRFEVAKVVVHPREATACGDLACAPGIRIEGRVADEDGRPIAGARVTWWDEGLSPFASARVALTDGDGRFRIRHVPPAGCVGVVARGFVAVMRELGAADAGCPLDLRMQRGKTVTGRVRREDGSPVVGAKLWCDRPIPAGTRSMAQMLAPDPWTDGEGRFVVDGLAEGMVEIIASTGSLQRPGMKRAVCVRAGTTGVEIVLAP